MQRSILQTRLKKCLRTQNNVHVQAASSTAAVQHRQEAGKLRGRHLCDVIHTHCIMSQAIDIMQLPGRHHLCVVLRSVRRRILGAAPSSTPPVQCSLNVPMLQPATMRSCRFQALRWRHMCVAPPGKKKARLEGAVSPRLSDLSRALSGSHTQCRNAAGPRKWWDFHLQPSICGSCPLLQTAPAEMLHGAPHAEDPARSHGSHVSQAQTFTETFETQILSLPCSSGPDAHHKDHKCMEARTYLAKSKQRSGEHRAPRCTSSRNSRSMISCSQSKVIWLSQLSR